MSFLGLEEENRSGFPNHERSAQEKAIIQKSETMLILSALSVLFC
jgi:hypothetical protein